MSMWVLRLTPPPAPLDGGTEAHLPLSLDETEDFTRAESAQHIRSALRAREPELAPESAARRAERIWRYISGPRREDTIVVPLQNGELAFAGVLMRAQFEEGRYVLPVCWHARRAGPKRFGRHRRAIDSAPEGLSEIMEQPLRVAIGDFLRLPGTRFTRWKWLLVVFIIIQIFYMALRLWRQENAGF